MPSIFRLCALTLVLAAGCDETSEGVRHSYVERHRDSFVYYNRPRTLAALKSVLAEDGYELVDAPLTSNELHTAPRSVGDDSVEIAVHVLDLKLRTGFLVELVHITRDKSGTVTASRRDQDLEWELIQRADPDGALAIMQTANERADKVAPRAHRQQ